MSDLPDPIVPLDCDIRGMPYMPLDLVRLFDSDFYVLSTGEEFKAGLSLWCKAFLQNPAGSLPSDERLLAHLSGAGSRWKNVRKMALHGWFQCSDGRLYHKVVAEKVADAWKARCEKRSRTEAARSARAEQRAKADGGNTPPAASSVTEASSENVTTSVTENVTRIVATPVTDDVTLFAAMSVTEVVTSSKGREGKGREVQEERRKEDPPKPPKGGLEDWKRDFKEFYAEYPRKKAPDDALKAYVQRRREGVPHSAIMAGLRKAEFSPDPTKIRYPAGWLRGGCWNDSDAPPDGMDPVLRAAGVTQDELDRLFGNAEDPPPPPSQRFLQ